MLLVKHSLWINKKTIGIWLVGFSGTLFLLLTLFQKMGNFINWNNQSYFGIFIFLFLALGAIYSSTSFSAFRSKEKSITYLTLPVSTSEKYFFELLTRVIGFIIIMPILFWVIANIEGRVIHYYYPNLVNYKFSFIQAIADNFAGGWRKVAFFQVGLFVLISAFAGACHFKKSPLIKTLFTISIIVIAYLLYTYLLVKGFNIENYNTTSNGRLLINSEKSSNNLFAIAATGVNLALLAYAWFRLKEREA